jgi:hypothetical protein
MKRQESDIYFSREQVLTVVSKRLSGAGSGNCE